MSNSQSTPINALIVEDYHVCSMVIQDMLGTLGLHSQVATNMDEALSEIKKTEFTIVFMDIQLGVESGLDVSKAIRKMDIKQPLIIACTANNAITSKDDVKQAGMDDMLVKPVNIQSFKEMLAKHGVI